MTSPFPYTLRSVRIFASQDLDQRESQKSELKIRGFQSLMIICPKFLEIRPTKADTASSKLFKIVLAIFTTFLARATYHSRPCRCLKHT